MAVSSSPNATDVSTGKKRTTNPGVRVIHGRIYDSESGKTCHQCRQKTRDFVAACKNQRNNKPCTVVLCHKCLFNRYGEKAEEVQLLEDWSCPKCRGICNCSQCRKKRGEQPTGILAHRARASGYSSVSELLHVNGHENFALVKNVKKETGASPKKQGASEKESLIASPRKQGKENSFDGRVDVNLDPPTPLGKISRKMKSKELGRMQDGSLKDDCSSKSSSCPGEKQGESNKLLFSQKEAASLEGSSLHLGKKIRKRNRKGELNNIRDGDTGHTDLLESSSKKSRVLNESNNNEVKLNGKVSGVLKEGDRGTQKPDSKKNRNEVEHEIVAQSLKENRNELQFQNRDLEPDIPLPDGTELTTVAGVKLPIADVGNALQFLEFCAAFGKTLNMKKGQSVLVLQELVNGRSRLLRRSEHSSAVVRFHIQLLSLLQDESESKSQILSPTTGKNSWLLALKNYISKSPNVPDSVSIGYSDKEEDGGYYNLDSLTKLRLLNFLCDEVLGTERIRNWIDDQNLKFAEKAKQAKERVLAAKAKEKSLKQNMMDKLAKAELAKNGAPLTISEHDKIVSEIKSKAARAHKEMLESMGMVPKKKQRAKAVRTEPIFLDVDGRAFWRLNGYSDTSNILVQDIGHGDYSVALGEKWITFDDEQVEEVEKHISFRERKARAQAVRSKIPVTSTETNV